MTSNVKKQEINVLLQVVAVGMAEEIGSLPQ
jgi:hypothetical protein